MKNPDALIWFDYARKDLRAARTLDQYGHPYPIEIVCFLCQQCAEKALKGFLIGNNQVASKTHDLIVLCETCMDIQANFSALYPLCDYLNTFSVVPRYPNELTIYEADAKRALGYAERVVTFTHTQTENPE